MILRFSSIGDIVLTTPVIRCVKQQTGAELHFLCKAQYLSLIENNPHLDQCWSFENDVNEVLGQLQKEEFDFIIDLHHNLRSLRIKRSLGVPSGSFPKLNVQKWLMVNFKWNVFPDLHIVDRYFYACKRLNIENDGKGLDYFLPKTKFHKFGQLPDEYIIMVLGAAHYTKQIPEELAINISDDSPLPVVLIGGKAEMQKAKSITKKVKRRIYDRSGRLTIHESASLIRNAKLLITGDTGMMHIGAAFKRPMIVLWGNTIPEFGMSPYYGDSPDLSKSFEIKNLPCRPCSKLGFDDCPKAHFRCMMDISANQLISAMNDILSRNSKDMHDS